MRGGLIVAALALAALAAWLFWAPGDRPRAARPRFALPERESADPEPEAPDLIDRVEVGFKKLESRPEVVVEGRVRDPEGEPVAGAEIRIDRDVKARTASDGRFSFRWPKRDSRVSLTIRHPAYLDAEESFARGDDVDITLDPGHAVAGRLAFIGGEPLPHCRVVAKNYGAGLPTEEASATTDDNGRFRVTGLREGKVVVGCNVGHSRVSQWVESGADDVLLLYPRTVLRVDLRRPDGARALGASVDMRWKDTMREGFREWNCDELIELPVVVSVQPGLDVELRAHAKGYRPLSRTIRATSTTPHLRDESIAFEPSGGASVVLDVWTGEGGRPEEILVEVVGTLRRMPRNGTRPIRLDDFDQGPVLLRVYPVRQMYLVRELKVVATEDPQPVRVELPRGALLHVHWPAADAMDLWPAGATHPIPMWRLTDFSPRGRIPEGAYTVKAYIRKKLVREEEITVRAGRENRFDWSEE